MTRRTSPRVRDADRTRRAILDAAVEEFGAKGLDGARVEAVAERAGSSKRMIFHYFGDKAGLHRAALASVYAQARSAEAALDIADLPAVQALRKVVEHTFDYDENNPAFVRMIAQENLATPTDDARLGDLSGINANALNQLGTILARGRGEGVFTREITPLDLHMLISALCFFRVGNRRTFGAAFSVDLSEPELRDRHRRLVVQTVLEAVGVEPNRY